MDQFADDASIVRTREFLTTASQMNGMLIIGTAIILSGTVALIGGRWILRPITRRRKQAATNFSIADLVALLLLLQLGLVCVLSQGPWDNRNALMRWLGFATLAAFAVWTGGITALARAGIRGLGRRSVFTVIILPTVLTLQVGIGLVLIGLASIRVPDAPMRVDLLALDLSRLQWLLAAILTVIACAGLRSACAWVAREGLATGAN